MTYSSNALAAFLKAEAEWNRDQITRSTRDVGDAIGALHGHLVYSKVHQTWKHITKPDGSAYKSWRPFIRDTIGDAAKHWSPAGRNAFIRILLDENFSVVAVAEMTGSSTSTVSRVGNGYDVGERTGGSADRNQQQLSNIERAIRANDRAVKDTESASVADLILYQKHLAQCLADIAEEVQLRTEPVASSTA